MLDKKYLTIDDAVHIISDRRKKLREQAKRIGGRKVRVLVSAGIPERHTFFSKFLPWVKPIPAQEPIYEERDHPNNSLEIDTLAMRDKALSVLHKRLVSMSSLGVNSFAVHPGADVLKSISAAVVEFGQNPVTVINSKSDIRSFNLKPRSHAVVRGVVGLGEVCSRDERYYMLEQNRHPDGSAGWRLLGETFARWPSGLYGIRKRRAVPLLPGSYSKDSRFYLPASLDDSEKLLEAGASMGRRGGFYIDLANVDLEGPISAFLPYVAQPVYRPLPYMAIPKSAWGGSLAGMLTKSSWDIIREDVFKRYGHLCQICGQKRGGQSLECHEIWDFMYQENVGGMRIQRLAGLACLCKSCHGAMHVGFSSSKFGSDKSAYRLADMNGWTMEEAEIAEQCSSIDYRERSKVSWAIDLGLINRNGKVVTLDSSKCESQGSLIKRISLDGAVKSTRIFGVSYRIGGKGNVVTSQSIPPQ